MPVCGSVSGNIPGPAGTPDCYVNLYDLTAMCMYWLECNNPDDERCTLATLISENNIAADGAANFGERYRNIF